MLLNDYTVNHRRSIDRATQSVNHLLDVFGGIRAADVTEDRVIAYQAHRLSERAANATITRECAALRRAFRLGLRAGRVGVVPYIRKLEEDNIRKGFFEREEFESVVEQLPSHLQEGFRVAYITGWRVRSELFTRQWCHVDLRAGWLRIEPGEDKNQSGRMFPLTQNCEPSSKLSARTRLLSKRPPVRSSRGFFTAKGSRSSISTRRGGRPMPRRGLPGSRTTSAVPP